MVSMLAVLVLGLSLHSPGADPAADPPAAAAAPPAPAVETSAAVLELLERLEQRAGAPEARAALTSLVAKGSVAVAGMTPGVGEERYLAPDRVLHRWGLAGVGEMTMGQVGERCWSSDPALGVTVRDGERAASVRRCFGVFRRAPWRELYVGAEAVGRAKVEGTAATELRMHARDGGADTWFVAEDGRLLRVDLELPDPMGGVLRCAYVFSEWKEVGGIEWPLRRVQRIGDMELVYTFESIEPNAPLTADDLAPPKDVAEALAAPAGHDRSAPVPGTFTIEKVAAQPVLSIRSRVKPEEISRTLAVQLTETLEAVARAKATMAGPPFSRYHDFGKSADGSLDLEAGIPVRAAAEGRGRVVASELPAGHAVMTWHQGPYAELPRTYEAMERWMGEQGLVARGGPWEVYWTDPGIEPDPSNWRTQILWPIEEPPAKPAAGEPPSPREREDGR